MKKQFQHDLISSFYLWFDNKLVVDGGAYQTGNIQNFKYSESQGVPTPLNAFYNDGMQFCAETGGYSNSIYVSGWELQQNLFSPYEVILDTQNGRVLMGTGFGTGITPSGIIPKKEINVYTTNETSEEVLLRQEFILPSGETYSESLDDVASAKYHLPCIFLSKNTSENNGFALGGTKENSSQIKAFVFADSVYQLDAVLSLYEDQSEKNFNLISAENFPYGPYFNVKDNPYNYSQYVESGKIDSAFIETVKTYKLKDSAQGTLNKIRKDIFIGYIYFNISCIRYPKISRL